MFYLVYKITNNINNKFYIGCHKTDDKNDGYMGSGKLIKRAISKYGIENFTKEILFECSNENEMFEVEKAQVTLCKESYNLKIGGEGGFDFINKTNLNNSKNQCKLGGLASNGFSGKSHTEETKKKIGFAKIGNTNWVDRSHTEETKEKMKQSAIGKHDGVKNSQYGSMWITNGTLNKKINKQEPISEGWKRGRIMGSELVGN